MIKWCFFRHFLIYIPFFSNISKLWHFNCHSQHWQTKNLVNIIKLTKSVEQSPPWKVGGFKLSMNFLRFVETWRIFIDGMSAHISFLSWARRNQSVDSSPVRLTSAIKISTHLRLGLLSGPFLKRTLYKILGAFAKLWKATDTFVVFFYPSVLSSVCLSLY